MHFRIRGNSAQIVKSVREAETGKTVSKPIGSVNIITGVLSDIARENLEADELHLVEAWVSRKQDIERRKRQLEAETLPATIGNIAQWVREASRQDVVDLSEEIVFALKDLQAVIATKLREAA